jgi:hypothetical protein
MNPRELYAQTVDSTYTALSTVDPGLYHDERGGLALVVFCLLLIFLALGSVWFHKR